MIRRIVILLFAFLCAVNLQSSIINYQLSIINFQSPVDYDISLAGNFGEPRPHHFHGGLDIRTEGREGKYVYAIGDGYVSRITVGLYGFGNAVYITHPTGVTSVYCHLKSFSPRIKAALRRYQYRHETSVADARLTPLDVPVSQGQFVALSGNSGHSTAPHLHLEIHDTRTWYMLDPYVFLNDHIADSVPPQAHGIMAVPQQGRGVFNGSTRKQTFSPSFLCHGSTAVTAWGQVGFALWADDYMQGSYNHYGVHETVLTVDGREVFRAVVDSIPVRLNRMVNAWGDYDHWLHHRNWYLKSYAGPGNRLPFLRYGHNRGIVDFNEPRDYHLEYILRDYKGNESRYPFVVRGEPASTTAQGNIDGQGIMTGGVQNSSASLSKRGIGGGLLGSGLFLPGVQLAVPVSLLISQVELSPQIVRRRADAVSDVYTFTQQSCPLLGDGEISLYARGDKVYADSIVASRPDTTKYYVTCDGLYAGGTYRKGWVTGRIRDLGAAVALGYDDLPPMVRPLSLSGGRLVLAVTDAHSGLASYKAYIDNRFVVFDVVEKTANVECRLNETPVRRTGQRHHLRFVATDNRNNTTAFETDFVY